jgi:hypothetical protein
MVRMSSLKQTESDLSHVSDIGSLKTNLYGLNQFT